MNHSLLFENQKRRLTFPIGLLICFAMFNAWQMGYIYYMGPSLVIEGRTPLPISMDNVTTLIAVSYVLSIIYMLILPKFVIHAERISAIVALTSMVGLFLPLSDDFLRLLIYTQTFCCCFMIGFESFIIINFFTEKTTLVHLTIAYAISTTLTAIVQNDVWPLSFSAFRILTVIMLGMMLYFFFKLPTKETSCPVYVKKGEGIRPPKKLFAGIYGVVFVSCLMTLCGSTAAGETPHGVSILYLADSIAAFILYGLYKKSKIHPLHSVSIFMILSVMGFLGIYISYYVPSLAYIACFFIGLGLIPCQLLPLYGVVLMKTYPSRYITPSIIGIALFTVILHSSLLEVFRNTPNVLNLVYMAVMVVLTTIYLRVEPYLIYTLTRKISFIEASNKIVAEAEDVTEDIPEAVDLVQHPEEPVSPAIEKGIQKSDETSVENLLAALTKREREVLELIACGHSNADIAKILFISEHTVNDHTKRIYRKLDVHSRHAAASILNRYETSAK